MVIYLLNSKMDNSAKITWMVVVAIAPVVGIPMFFYVKSNFGHNILRKRLLELEAPLSITTGFDRDNLYLEVCHPSVKRVELLARVRERRLSGVPEHCHDLFSRRRGKV